MSSCSSRCSPFSFFSTIRGPLHRPMCLLLFYKFTITTQHSLQLAIDRPRGLNVCNILAFVLVSPSMLSGCCLGKSLIGLPNFSVFLYSIIFTRIPSHKLAYGDGHRFLPWSANDVRHTYSGVHSSSIFFRKSITCWPVSYSFDLPPRIPAHKFW